MSLPRVILASASPRRRQLLELIGVAHEVHPADIDETYLDGEQPAQHAERLARAKAAKVAASQPSALVVGADTIVVINGSVLGKPRTADDASRMLRLLSGRTHTVMTGVAASWQGRLDSELIRVQVTFRVLTDEDIARYVATGEPLDKAGAYGIQGYGATIVRRIDGDYFAVMGLSLVTLVALLGRLGLAYDFPR